MEPAEGRLEFLAYLVNEEQHNQSVQVKYLRKQVPQASSNTLTQFFYRVTPTQNAHPNAARF